MALSLRAAQDRLIAPLARAASAFLRQEGWFLFGFARLEDHARERFDRSGRWVRELAKLGDALPSSPALESALVGSDGEAPLGQVAASLLVKVAAPESMRAWIDRARDVPLCDLRAEVAAARRAGSIWPPGGAGRDELREVGGDRGGGRVAQDAAAARSPVPEGAGGHLDDDVDDDRQYVSMMVPRPVAAAFDEALDLFRAVEGGEATVTSFVEALVADAMAGPHPPDLDPDVHARPLDHGPRRAAVERAMARSTDGWSHLPRPGSGRASHEMALAAEALARLDGLTRRAGAGDAAALDGQLRDLLRLEDEIQIRLGDLLSRMSERRAWSRLRFESAGHYAEQRLGVSRSTAMARIRAARGLRRLPLLRDAHARGEVGREAALQMVRILRGEPAGAAAQRRWIERAREATVKRIKDEARALARRWAEQEAGQGAERQAESEVARAGAWTGASSTDSGTGARVADSSDARLPLDDAAWHASLRREPGMSRERVARLAAQVAKPLPALPSADVFLRLRLPGPVAASFLAAIESERRRLALEVDRIPWDEPWPDTDARPSAQAARRFAVRCRRVPVWAGLLAILEKFVATWDDPEAMPRREGDIVYARDGYRCTAPGCTSRRNLEQHHVIYRSRQGGHGMGNRICACRFHHQRGEHGGLASCRGEAPLGIVWRLGRKEHASWYRNERALVYGDAAPSRGRR